MSLTRRLALAVLVAWPAASQAQVSGYLPIDDPRLPYIENLINAGVIRDPSPFIRPFRRVDLMRALDAADTNDPAVARVRTELREAFLEPVAEATWGAEVRGGVQAFTQARIDPLHPEGIGATRPYLEADLQATAGPVVLASRPAIEPRLVLDPDWIGRKDLTVTGRMVEAYISSQWKPARISYGQMARHWGPQGLTSLTLGDYSYPRPAFGLDFYFGPFHLGSEAAQLHGETDTLGLIVHRYFFAHRLDLRASKRVQLALFETNVLSGHDQNFDARYSNPVSLLLLSNEYGEGDNANIEIGADISWQAARWLTLQGEGVLDDFQYKSNDSGYTYPNRFAFTLAAFGPIHNWITWRLTYSLVSSLAFRTTDQYNNFVDAGVGIGRNYGGNDQVTLTAGVPLPGLILLTPELAYLRQGEGSLASPAPPVGPVSSATPTVFAGVIESTARAALTVSGAWRWARFAGSAGYQHVSNQDHVTGQSDNQFVGRLFLTVGWGRRGSFK
jgi:hypothetical protein